MQTSAVTLDKPMETGAQPARGDRALAEKDIALVRDVPVKLTARLGFAQLTIERLFALKSGDIVELDALLDDAITFYMGERPVARGNLVAVGDNYAIELTDIL